MSEENKNCENCGGEKNGKPAMENIGTLGCICGLRGITKGEWRVGNNIIYSPKCEDAGDIVCLAPLEYEDNITHWTANAQLISAAPDLLQVCEDLAAYNTRSPNLDNYFEIMKRIHKAIAKAKGGDGEI